MDLKTFGGQVLICGFNFVKVNRTASEMAAFIGMKHIVATIKGFIPLSDVNYYTKKQGELILLEVIDIHLIINNSFCRMMSIHSNS